MTLKEKLSLIQQNIRVPKNRSNEFGNFKYRSAEDILKAAKKFESECRVLFLLTDSIENIGNSNYIKSVAKICDLDSPDYIEIAAYAKEPSQPKAKMDDSQTTGSTSSYARKYALNGLLLLDDSIDPDSNNAIDTGAPASDAQVHQIESLCKQHNVNLEKLYQKHKIKSRPTAMQAGFLLNIFKKQFGSE